MISYGFYRAIRNAELNWDLHSVNRNMKAKKYWFQIFKDFNFHVRDGITKVLPSNLSSIWHLLVRSNWFKSTSNCLCFSTHWGRVTHICVSKLTNVGILLNGNLGIYFSEILSEIHTFSSKKMLLKMSSVKRRPFLSRPQCAKTLLSNMAPDYTGN